MSELAPPFNSEFDHAVDGWRRSQVVYEMPGKGVPEAYELLEQISSRPQDFHDLLVSSLGDASQLVVAYCLLALDRMKSPIIQSLPPELLKRRDKITLHAGSFSSSMDLGGLARQLRKRAKRHDS